MDWNILFRFFELGIAIPITAIVLGIGHASMKNLLKSRERMAELRIKLQDSKSGAIRDEIAAVRKELEEFRSASSQYDLSLDHTLHILNERVSHLEEKTRFTASPRPTAKEEPAVQRLDIR